MPLVKEKLAPCFNIIPGVKSIYTWKGELHEDEEVILFIKTREELFEKVKDSIKSTHSYECPEIIAIPIKEGFKPYLDWIDENTR
jgi:periplasmic divalent cation tolerance protein